MVKKAAILGFGTVGQGIYDAIQTHDDELQSILGEPIEIVAILVKNEDKGRAVNEGTIITTSFQDIVSIPELEIVFEAIVDCEPAFTYIQALMKKGCHIITANKKLVAHYGSELMVAAEKYGVKLRYDATVAGAVPIIGALQTLLRTNRMNSFQGILNGTSNFILTEMRTKGLSFDDALLQAQTLGYAEADPASDIEGIDAWNKLVILIRTITGNEPSTGNIHREGITSISQAFISLAEKIGLRFKHLAYFNQAPLQYWVKPVLIDASHPFYQVDGVNNSIHLDCSLAGELSFTGPGAGKLPTASALLEDLVGIYQGINAYNGQKTVKLLLNESISAEEKNWVIFCKENQVAQLPNQLHQLQTYCEAREVVLLVKGSEIDIQLLQNFLKVNVFEYIKIQKAKYVELTNVSFLHK
ncbi:homoserine dehydrogenase [Caldibacillus lycopersici]|uniref:Homoserine dehydrogenase n=1 Tax=Perspicuibacillus lycopersici TaxID=1325689 RepID=A0AAE3IX98_9BACI|nr:homoserine dehydrogenase [Perspicuibacillus lycopersici]MCU9615079.1 homoserine dehydrogenase [Perspicuibacillus lycopersici]